MKEDESKTAEAEYVLRNNQYRNFQRVLNSSMPKKRYEYLAKKVLPGYQLRRYNAMTNFLKVVKLANDTATPKKATVRKPPTRNPKSDTLTVDNDHLETK